MFGRSEIRQGENDSGLNKVQIYRFLCLLFQSIFAPTKNLKPGFLVFWYSTRTHMEL